MDPQVQLEGEIDVQVSDGIRESLLRAVADAPGTTLQVDLSRVTFLDSSGLSALIAALKAAQAKGGALRVVEVPHTLRRLFDVTGMAEHFGLDGHDGNGHH